MRRRLRVTLAALLTCVPLASSVAAQSASPRPAAPAKAPATTSVARPSVAVRPVGEAELRARVSAYWRLRVAKDLTGMYPFYSAEYRRRVTRQAFVAQTRLVRFQLTDAGVADTAIDGSRATVGITFKFMQPTLGQDPIEQHVQEVWVRERNQWFKLDEPVVLPFPVPAAPAPTPAAGKPKPGGPPPER